MRDHTNKEIVRDGTNLLASFDQLFLKDAEVPQQAIRSAAGVDFGKASVSIKLLMVAERMHLLKVYFDKGTVVPRHVHEDHSTICCLQFGRLLVHIGDESFPAGPGDVWQHPRGIWHNHEVLEDACVLEVKSPASKTW
jgi:quercetin dioxygenase-like cupin family protein